MTERVRLANPHRPWLTRACTAVVLTLAAVPPSATAAPPPPVAPAATPPAGTPADRRAAATRKVVEAERLHDGGDARGALEKLREAWALYPSPALHFNMALALRTLGRPADALHAFQRFLAEAPTTSPELAARRTEATAHVAALRAEVGLLEVVADVPDAEVLVDGRAVGRTPLPAAIPLDPGRHGILIRAPRRVSYEDDVDLSAGTRLRIRARLPLASPAPLAPAALVTVPAASPSAPPVFKRWWFWTGAAALAGGIATALALGRADGRTICPDGCALGEYAVDRR